ncbi:MAG: sulfite exporter TauE/SafE family protein [Thaumarchaeota archaeon]|nr:sulfite exporter TauE/SafE family protein [Nitrososphaerota archaeon]
MIFLSLVSGIVVGFSLGLIGGGGSILAVPLLVYVIGVEPHVALGTSALSVATNALTSLMHHKKVGHVKIKEGLVFALPGIIGALIGAQIGLLTPSKHLLFLFGLFIIVVAIMMLRRKPVTLSNETHHNHGTFLIHKNRLIITGFAVGATAGYFGIGGGFLIAPALMYAASLNIIDAIGTSLLPVSVFGVTTAIRYSIEGQIQWLVSILFIIGGIGGGFVGTRLSTKIHREKLVKIFSILLIFVALFIIVKTMI